MRQERSEGRGDGQGGRAPSLKERFSQKEVEEAIRKCNGRWAAVAAALNCSYDQLRVWMTHHPKHAELADQLRMSLVDEAEQQMRDLMYSADEKTRLAAAQFVLKTLGRARGWGETAQRITTDGKTVSIEQVFGA